ncbi:MAG: tRNA pseudouridine(54/55) synthase Pus10 [Desulfurococcus sp.]|nr:tRNA pseudouridine(54/55) synthase Pus10 [Desulfurococcus sp.]
MTQSSSPEDPAGIIATAEKVLSKHPLCDRCLGRLFARRGLELSNEERGRAIKTLLSMKLHSEYTAGKIGLEYIEEIALNSGDPVSRLYEKLSGRSLEPRRCFICMNKLTESYIDGISREAAQLLEKLHANTFLVGVSLDEAVILRELEVSAATGLSFNESIKNELKREVGKKISKLTGLQPDFSKPDVVVIVHVDRDLNYKVTAQVNPIFLKATYWKKGRRISHVPWTTSSGARRFPESLQDFVRDSIASLFDAVDVKVHAAGREDVDARMLGSGRPVIVEIVEPGFRNVDLDLLNHVLNGEFIKVTVAGLASRKHVEAVKEGARERRKIYRISVLTEKPVTTGELEKLVEFFKNRTVRQRTPTRVLRRKRDKERIKRVYSIEVLQLTPRIFEALVYCDGGLYVKELVHCDNGRTKPCFSEILGFQAYPLELDVVYVENQHDL